MDSLRKKNLTSDISFALTNFALVFSYALCCAAAIGQSLGAVAVITAGALFSSVLLKDRLLCPNPLLLVPLIAVFSRENTVAGVLSLFAGAVIYSFLNKPLRKIKVPYGVYRFFKIIFAICATVLFTNIYFGIGSQGSTPVAMLKSYISLGFHPHFMGLLTGTITLFMMITYPFKFRKLNKYLPAEFVSLLVPFVINILLNPDKSLTAINETHFFEPISLGEFAKCLTFNGDAKALFANVALGMVLFAISFFVLFSQRDEKEAIFCSCVQCTFSAFACIPVSAKAVRGITVKSAIISVFAAISVCILFPSLLSRMPLHSVGALLIVSSWQEAVRKEAC